jgi:hypothetical protein
VRVPRCFKPTHKEIIMPVIETATSRHTMPDAPAAFSRPTSLTEADVKEARRATRHGITKIAAGYSMTPATDDDGDVTLTIRPTKSGSSRPVFVLSRASATALTVRRIHRGAFRDFGESATVTEAVATICRHVKYGKDETAPEA